MIFIIFNKGYAANDHSIVQILLHMTNMDIALDKDTCARVMKFTTLIGLYFIKFQEGFSFVMFCSIYSTIFVITGSLKMGNPLS